MNTCHTRAIRVLLPNSLLASLFLAAILATTLATTQAQITLPRASPKTTTAQTVGVTDISITYSSPSVKGRTIWGDLVPYGEVWRAGANEATKISFSDDVTINGNKLATGSYSVHMIPSKDEWTIIFNKIADQWGSFDYKATEDALRVKVKPQTAEMQEQLWFGFSNITTKSAQLVMRWEKVQVGVDVAVDTNTLALNKIRKEVATAKSDDWRPSFQAAGFAFQEKIAPDEAAAWLEKSISIKETYSNLSLKARVLANSGKQKEAIVQAEKAIALGKASQPKVDTSATEK
ncbi:MAG: DUF2911 domain-containing protein, partial [Pyrinomonadaceae bacterium]